MHSFSVLLTGESSVDLTLRLRVAICLEMLERADIYFQSQHDDTEEKQIAEAKRIIKDELILKNGAWLNSDTIKFLAPILKRPLMAVSRMGRGKGEGKDKQTWTEMYYYWFPNFSTGFDGEFFPSSYFDSLPDKYSEEWVVYNSGGHFQPLIKK